MAKLVRDDRHCQRKRKAQPVRERAGTRHEQDEQYDQGNIQIHRNPEHLADFYLLWKHARNSTINPAQKIFKNNACFETRDVISYAPVFTTPSASLTQLVECHLAKVVVEGSSPLARSICWG